MGKLNFACENIENNTNKVSSDKVNVARDDNNIVILSDFDNDTNYYSSASIKKIINSLLEGTIPSIIETKINAVYNNIFPVGYIICSLDTKFNPNDNLNYPGKWEKIKGRFLYGSESETNEDIGGTGGQKSVGLSITQLPKVEGKVAVRAMSINGNTVSDNSGLGTNVFNTVEKDKTLTEWKNSITSKDTASYPDSLSISFGNNEEHENMPPYIVVNMWKRVE